MLSVIPKYLPSEMFQRVNLNLILFLLFNHNLCQYLLKDVSFQQGS
jgi:hypothetical protein